MQVNFKSEHRRFRVGRREGFLINKLERDLLEISTFVLELKNKMEPSI